MHYTSKGRANYYDCDSQNRLKISAAMRYMQQTSSEHLESIDISPVKLYRENMVFLLSKMCLKVHRMPYVSEPIIIGTVATQPRGARFAREFVIDSPEGERLISALSLWVLVDPVSRRILRPASFPYDIDFRGTVIGNAIDDVRFPKLLEAGERIETSVGINYSHIDTNSHVNNSVYADFVCDSLPYDKLTASGLDTLVIAFQNEATHGDLLQITTSVLTEKEYYVLGKHNDSPCFEALAVLN